MLFAMNCKMFEVNLNRHIKEINENKMLACWVGFVHNGFPTTALFKAVGGSIENKYHPCA